LTLARQHRPDLRAADLDVQMAESSLGKEKSTLYPRLDAMAQAETNTEDFSSNPSNRLLMVRAAWAIGDPTYGARREKAKAGEQAGRLTRDALEEQAKMEILHAVRGFEGAREALPLLDLTVDQARRSLEMFRPLYREGRQSIMEVLRAEEALARAEAQRLEGLTQLNLNRARALAAAGALDEGALGALSAALEEKP
jgi:outer membrane protein TolC